MMIKRLTQCSLEEIVSAWNKGFEGYFFKMEMNAQQFLNKLVVEGLSPDLSIIAFDKKEPVGIVLNGFRYVNGKKISWNGGTGVSTSYRGKGVSRILMEETFDIYKQENVEIATLEAIKQNEKAIRLYHKYGYEICDNLLYLSGQYQSTLSEHPGIKDELIRPEQLASFPFYKEEVPWQCGWQCDKQGEAKVFYNEKIVPVGYALYRRGWNEEGKVDRILFYQLELLEEGNMEDVPHFLNSIVDENVNITFINFPASNPISNHLIEKGLNVTTEQLQMRKQIN